jgi:hypothetical protein
MLVLHSIRDEVRPTALEGVSLVVGGERRLNSFYATGFFNEVWLSSRPVPKDPGNPLKILFGDEQYRGGPAPM